jgi:hypothetical protein
MIQCILVFRIATAATPFSVARNIFATRGIDKPEFERLAPPRKIQFIIEDHKKDRKRNPEKETLFLPKSESSNKGSGNRPE